MNFIIKKFLTYIDSIALSVFIAGFPIIYYLRDGLMLAPNNTVFTIALSMGPLLISFLIKNFRYFNFPNGNLYLLLTVFLILCFSYLILRDPYTSLNFKYEIFSFILIFFILISSLYVSINSLERGFLIFGFIICTIGSILLLIYVYNDPYFIFGQRASIKFSDEENASGNPHIYSKTAFFGLIFSLLVLKYKTNKIGIIIPIVAFLLFCVVLFMTQTLAEIISSFIFLSLFIYFNLNVNKAKSLIRTIFSKWYLLLFFLFSIVKSCMLINENEKVIKPTFDFVTNRIEKLTNSIFTSEEKSFGSKSNEGDESSNMRISMMKNSIELMEENFNENKFHFILFGNGYKNSYIDVPHMEVLDSFGIFMFLLYTYLFYLMIKHSIREMKNPKSSVNEFIAYGFIFYFVLNFSGGLIIDYTRIGYYIIICRFLKN